MKVENTYNDFQPFSILIETKSEAMTLYDLMNRLRDQSLKENEPNF